MIIGNRIIIPIDEVIFFREVETTNQISTMVISWDSTTINSDFMGFNHINHGDFMGLNQPKWLVLSEAVSWWFMFFFSGDKWYFLWWSHAINGQIYSCLFEYVELVIDTFYCISIIQIIQYFIYQCFLGVRPRIIRAWGRPVELVLSKHLLFKWDVSLWYFNIAMENGPFIVGLLL